MLQIWSGYRKNMEGNMTEIWYFTFLAADTQSLRHHTLTNNASHCYLRWSISAFAKKEIAKSQELRWGSYIQELQKRTEMRPNIAGFAKIIAKNQNLLPETIMNWCRISKISKMGLCVMYCKKYSVYGFQEMRRVKNNPIVSWEMVWW